MVNDTSRKTRIHKGTVQLTERDFVALRWIADQQAIRFDHLRLLLGRYKYPTQKFASLSVSATRHALERWERAGLIDHPKKVFASYPSYVWLSEQASSEYISPYPYEVPQPPLLLHLDMVNAMRLYIEAIDPFDRWQSYRACKQELPPDAQQNLASHPALPDAEMFVGRVITALAIFDRLPDDLERLVRDYAAQYSFVWYIIPSRLVATAQRYFALLPLENQGQITIIYQETIEQAIHTALEKE